ncbi:hypothetical protein [Cylindrospermum sp. FACHB-282]|uniref:hypothetical protein n=1 Tax=Cylindrospermum sp. FACHB-282 TaxID=2692794 RepID=UPI001688F029|nr:hypothetical protein [Cylindrospermum sp. FACHB-282]MBD2386076.1 hypothetical protein [Cylindrospermum sp. FACHB-282]
MSDYTKLHQILQSMKEVLQQVVNYILASGDNNYPMVKVKVFEYVSVNKKDI